jgi:hypothetical protein
MLTITYTLRKFKGNSQPPTDTDRRPMDGGGWHHGDGGGPPHGGE